MAFEQPFSNRDTKLDVLRGIGLLCIILAHVGPPSFLFQLRNFDVPLMVLVSGASFCISRSQNEKYGRYLYSRFLRLVMPTWVFLSFFFGVAFIASIIFNRTYPYTTHTVLTSYALMSGIGYVWVIRVFFLVAIVAPIAKRFFPCNLRDFSFLVAFYIVYELADHFISFQNYKLIGVLFSEFVYYIIPYGLVFVVGMSLNKISRHKRFLIAIFLLFVFISMAGWFLYTTGNFVGTQASKYPARIYYLSYAIGISLLLYNLFEFPKICSLVPTRLLAWIGQNTMWIYLWHIFILAILSWVHFKSNFIVMFLVVFVASAAIVIIQERALKIVLSKVGNSKHCRLIAIVFKG